MRVSQHAAYVLLNRAYGETSWVAEVFTREYGRLGLLAKGGRRPKSPFRGLLLPFQALIISWVGKGELPTLTQAELRREPVDDLSLELSADSLVCGFYCNELLIKLCHRHDPHPKLFDAYHQTLQSLLQLMPNETNLQHNILRQFETACLKEVGYAVDFSFEYDGVTVIEKRFFYQYQAQRGFVRVTNSELGFSGEVLLAMSQDTCSLSNNALRQSKLLMRDILHKSFGSKPMISRNLFYPGRVKTSQPAISLG